MSYPTVFCGAGIRPYLAFLLFITGAIATAQKKEGSSENVERPNIIFLLSDDQTSVATGCYGNDQVKTPNMDQLAKDGVLFLNHYNTTSICMASRANILTGMYEYKTGCNFMHGDLGVDKFENSYPVLLKAAGYFTGFAGKVGFVLEGGDSEKIEDGLPVGYFDKWGGGPEQTEYETAKNPTIAGYAKEYPHSTRAYGAWAGDFIKEAKSSGKPFCMSISFKAPHLPFTPDPFFDGVYAGQTYKKPDNYGAENATHLSPQAKSGRQYNSYNFWRESEASYQEAITKYNQLIHGVDYAIGMIRKSLAEQGVDKNTIIIFTSDNGYSCGAHNLAGKVLPYEEASRSPFIIYDPRAPQSQRGIKRKTVTANIDMAPTILSYAGLEIPENMDGENLVPLMAKESGVGRDHIALTNMWGNDEIQAMSVVTEAYKYIYWQYTDERMRPTEELFHISEDKLEMHNLAKDDAYKTELAQMRKLYDGQYKRLVKEGIKANDYEKYAILFNRNAPESAKKQYRQLTYKKMIEKSRNKN
ncbi:sulfatase family protein [Zobellia galactanivorans]|uniref:sulfatase family protein n=1 Tax=Zobellia galactanivorans (strain DSM 12802 / CCUG 47099 / CIP 106680 / NCIMB 13871 / Dsij) TaxID=63186 RepID=UPI001C070AF1|nr:sulfatase [Zobellia galactanivorans]MBU3024206.1 sulfatase [Zobellia galactanivorans]